MLDLQNIKHKTMRISDAAGAVVVSVVGGMAEESLEWKTTAAVRF